MTKNSSPKRKLSRSQVVSVSIVIRNFNYEKFVSDTVESALAQTLSNTEVIVIDDGSTDRSRQVLRRYGAQIQLVLQPNGGEGAAMNSGFARATGEWVIFLDSDDVLAPSCAEQVIKNAAAPDVTRVIWSMYLLNEEGRLTGHVQPTRTVPELTFEESMARHGLIFNVCQSCNAYRRDVLADIFPLDARAWPRAPDVYLNAVSTLAGRTAIIDAPLGGYRVHGRNLSLQNSVDVSANHHILNIHPRLDSELGSGLITSSRR